MRHTSSIHSSESSLTFDFVSYPRVLCDVFIYVDILNHGFSSCFVSLFASMKISFGILSGSRLLFLFSLFIILSISLSLNLFSVLLLVLGGSFRTVLTCLVIFSVHIWYSSLLCLAWYRSSK